MSKVTISIEGSLPPLARELLDAAVETALHYARQHEDALRRGVQGDPFGTLGVQVSAARLGEPACA